MPKGDAKEVALLMAQLAESQSRELRLREALDDLRSGDGDPWCAEQQADSALALPFDDSVLREMVEAAKAEEREALMLPVFDGNAVYSALRDDAKKRTSPENVSDALDALAKLMREATRYRGDK